MAKYKFRLKITNLEMEFEGEREAAPAVDKLPHKVVALLNPAEMLPSEKPHIKEPAVDVEPVLPGNSRSRAGRRSPTRRPEGGAGTKPVDFKHDAEKYGVPQQTWKVSDKLIWLMYVLPKQAGGDAWSPQCLVETFNKYFKESGAMNPRNVYRDLTNLQLRTPSVAAADKSKSPPQWYLIEEGKKLGAQLVQRLTSSQTVTA